MKPKKIAVLGSGVGAMTAVHELLKSGENLEITVYQMGWRLGGKGASGRNMKSGMGQRIEEHGLHMWSGLYENAFRVMREVYDELARPLGSPLARCFDAFKKHDTIVLWEKWEGQWLPWSVRIPLTSSLPGEKNAKLLPPLWDYAEIFIGLIWKDGCRFKPLTWALQFVLWIGILFGFYATKMLMWLFLKLKIFGYVQIFMLAFAELAIGFLWTLVHKKLGKAKIRRFWIISNFAYGHLHGLIKEDCYLKGLDHLDAYDYREWLKEYIFDDEMETSDGRKSLTLSSPLMQFLYDAQFSYIEGDLSRPDIAAGSSVKTLLRMAFTCKGAVLWKMQAAMGDVVFAPMYELFSKKGVTFKFFHRLCELKLHPELMEVASLKFLKQAEIKNAHYSPLFDVKGLPSWPSEPLWDQLSQGEILRKKAVDFESYTDKTGEELILRHGVDFDEVIWGIPVGGLKWLAGDLIDRDERYQKLLTHLKTVCTGALQVWMKKPQGSLNPALMEHLKTTEQSCTEPLMVTYHPTPLNTIADMSFLTEHESWPSEQDRYPLSQYYLCGPLAYPTDQNPAKNEQTTAERQVREEAKYFFKELAGPLFPGGTTVPFAPESAFDDKLFVDNLSPETAADWPRLMKQYFRANISPSEQFTLTNKGSTFFRIAPGKSGVTNLKLAGDWTDNTFNYANVEATTMSGMLCAQALTGLPKNKHIVGLGFGSRKKFT